MIGFTSVLNVSWKCFEIRSLISDVDGGGFTSAQDSQNDRSDNISQSPSYDSSDGEDEEEFTVESKSRR